MVQKAPKMFIAGSHLLQVLRRGFFAGNIQLRERINLRLLEVDENRRNQKATVDEPCHPRLQKQRQQGYHRQTTHYDNLTCHETSG
jgi:hypothetical protein